jgi:hypothetical protein
MTEETLDFTRTTTPASDADVQSAADDIFAILKTFDSPKDAGSALTLAHYKMISESFPPAFRMEALEAVDGHFQAIKDLLNDGWQ